MTARVTASLLLAVSSVLAQDSPFLPEGTYRKLTNEISGDIAFDSLRTLTLFHAPTGGSRGFHQEAQWVMERAKEAGLEDVHFISMKLGTPGWTPKSAELWLLEPVEKKLGSYQQVATTVMDNSPTADVTGEVVDVGQGTQESDYAGKEVKGKIALASGPSPTVAREAAKRGAVGIICYSTSRMEFPDQVPWMRMGLAKEGEPAVPGISISERTGFYLRQLLGTQARPVVPGAGEGGPKPVVLRARIKVEAELDKEPTHGLVEAWIRGTEIHDQAMVLTAHMQEEKFSANDDRSGTANVLEIGRALARLIREGKLPRPRRDIRFWWANEINAEYQYFRENPEERRRVLADLNEDMVGARQSAGSRVQHVTRTPFSRASFLSDVVESIVNTLVLGNTSFLAAGARNQPGTPYTKPIFAQLGTHERYDARVVPHFNNTDHMVFNDGIIGIPGVTFTNWPDEYIHSSDDDLWQIDRTQLQRNAVSVAAAAWYLANAGEAQVAEMAGYMAAAGRQRIARDLATGQELIQKVAQDRPAAFGDASNLLHQAFLREARALESLSAFAPPGSNSFTHLGAARTRLLAEEPKMKRELEASYHWLTGSTPPPPRPLKEAEKKAASQIPKNLGTVEEYLENRNKVKFVSGLQSIMAYEVYNFVDGKNSVWDIYQAVKGEAQSAGEWYYGKVSLEDVIELLTRAGQAKVLAFQML